MFFLIYAFALCISISQLLVLEFDMGLAISQGKSLWIWEILRILRDKFSQSPSNGSAFQVLVFFCHTNQPVCPVFKITENWNFSHLIFFTCSTVFFQICPRQPDNLHTSNSLLAITKNRASFNMLKATVADRN